MDKHQRITEGRIQEERQNIKDECQNIIEHIDKHDDWTDEHCAGYIERLRRAHTELVVQRRIAGVLAAQHERVNAALDDLPEPEVMA